MPGAFDQSNVPSRANETLPEPLPADPFPLLARWYEDAHERSTQPNPNAMTLAAVDGSGAVSARIVLCKQLEPATGSLVFYTNYESRKGCALEENPRAAVVFHWDALDRQIRVEGRISRVTAAESDAYFATRPWESRVGAWASRQSRPIASRQAFVDQIRAAMARFGIDPERPPATGAEVHIPRPPHWGGYRLSASYVELWCSAPGRLHDRAAWSRELTPESGGAFRAGPWAGTRLQP